jgi:hypothetical protein
MMLIFVASFPFAKVPQVINYQGRLTDSSGNPVANSVQLPEAADIRTCCTRLIINNAGNMGNTGNDGAGGYNMNYLDDCDTSSNWAGNNDNSTIYLYDASPFVLRINDAGDTVLNHYMYNADWLSDDGMLPLQGLLIDSIPYNDYQYGYTGKFITKDSSIGLEIEYFAPKHPDTCKFIVLKQRFYNNTGGVINGVYLGNLLDWDIPSDSGVENGSDYDRSTGPNSRDLMYCFGGEYGIDSDVNNDCVLADQRYGGMAFYNGVRLPSSGAADSIENPLGPWWTHMLADWVFPSSGFVAGQLYRKMENMGSSWETWQSTLPTMEDSIYQDLYMAAVFGKFDIDWYDTLLFVNILASEYDDGYTGFSETIDMARAWVESRPDIWTWEYYVAIGRCCYGDPLAPSCEDIGLAECQSRPSMFSWDPTLTCDSEPCQPPIGRCCYGDPRQPSCEDITLSECQSKPNLYSWDYDLNCSDDSCPIPIGRCCFGDPFAPNCADLTEEDCSSLDSVISWTFGLNCAEHSCLGLVGYWMFDEGAGKITYDSSGYENHGAFYEGPGPIILPVWVDGLFGMALEFGDCNYVVVPHSPELGSTDLTVMCWLRPYLYDNFFGPIAKKRDGVFLVMNWMVHMFDPAAHIRFVLNNDGVESSPCTTYPTMINRWNHFAVTYEEREVKIYINGQLDPAFPYIMSRDIDTEYGWPVLIGAVMYYDGFVGKIDEVMIFNRALSETEIRHYFLLAGCGDTDGDGSANMLDILLLISYLYKSGPAPQPPEAGDADGDGNINMLDILFLIGYLYKDGPGPVCP